ncbi:uncharacterized protein LOC144601449 [Rhinoraja longicauda]
MGLERSLRRTRARPAESRAGNDPKLSGAQRPRVVLRRLRLPARNHSSLSASGESSTQTTCLARPGSLDPPGSEHQRPSAVEAKSFGGEKPSAGSEIGRGSRPAKTQSSHPTEKRWKCGDCGKGYSYPSRLEIHRRSHTGEKPFPCSLCGKGFPSPSSLKQHWRIHNGERPFICAVCEKGFSSSTSLTEHHRVHTGERPFACSECGAGHSCLNALKKHHRVHTGERPFACSECGAGYSCFSSLRKHQRVHNGERPFACSVCGKRFARNDAAMSHERGHTGGGNIAVLSANPQPEDPTTFILGRGRSLVLDAGWDSLSQPPVEAPTSPQVTAGAGFCCCHRLQQLLLIMMSMMTSDSFSVWASGESSTQTTCLARPGSLDPPGSEHQRPSAVEAKSFGGEKPSAGSEIGRGSRPAKTKRKPTEKRWKCGDCGKGYSYPSKLEIHRRSHTGEKPFPCSLCRKGFPSSSSLKQHRQIHSGERPFICAVCEKGFPFSNSLMEHQRVHTGERPFACSECGGRYTRLSALRSHHRVHTGERPFACSECSAGYSCLSTLMKHRRVHNGERPFACSVCGKRFARIDAAMSHERGHTGGGNIAVLSANPQPEDPTTFILGRGRSLVLDAGWDSLSQPPLEAPTSPQVTAGAGFCCCK